jgi:hypothetical protein
MDVCLSCFYVVLSCVGRSVSDGLITRPEEFLPYVSTVLSAYQEKTPVRNAIHAHAQDFAPSDELLLAMLKAFIPQPLNKQQTKVFHVF